MNTHTNSKAQNFGHNAARVWLWVKRKECALVSGLISKGLPTAVAKIFVFLLNLTALALLLYGALWLVALGTFVLVFILFFNNVDVKDIGDEERNADGSKWENGHQGYGLYTKLGSRVDNVDPHQP